MRLQVVEDALSLLVVAGRRLQHLGKAAEQPVFDGRPRQGRAVEPVQAQLALERGPAVQRGRQYRRQYRRWSVGAEVVQRELPGALLDRGSDVCSRCPEVLERAVGELGGAGPDR